eukprot:XP_011678107.1 PREDICTED: P-selectin isoform X2 [Strongylocentrotus purpuratus]
MMDGLTNTAVWVCLEYGSWLGHTPICKDVACPSPPIAAYSELDPPSAEAPVVNQTISYRCSSSEYTLIGSNLNRCLQDGTWENDPPICQRDCDDTADQIRRYSDLTCYRRLGGNSPRNWSRSLETCNDNGELLATVKDAETQTFLVDLIREQIYDSVWIGAMEGRDWIWRHSGEYIERFFWQNPFPSSNSEDCIELSYQDESFSWSPRSNQKGNGLLCQYDRSCQSVGLSQSDMVLEYMDTCFQFLDVSRNCDDGAEECNERGGFLAEILDESTNALMLDRALYLRSKGVNTAWWIGGYDENSGRSWYWSDKTRMNYEEWYKDEPSSNAEECLEMRGDFQYRWNDLICYWPGQTLCQIGIPACGDPGKPLHGNRLPDDRTTYSVNATLHFTCQEGYTLSGESVLRCMNNGAWNHQRPSCEAVECEGSPPEVALASTTILGSAYQDIALYTCQDSYIPDNEPISFCQHTGNWSSSYFTCTTRSPCNSTPCVNGGTCTVNGSSFTCTCPSSYTGPTCDEEFSPCNSNPCINGGTCLDINASSFNSTCTPGYIGSTCNEAIAAGSSVAVLFILVVIVLAVILFRRNKSATSKSEGKESDSSPQYENPVFDQSQTDAHTYQDLNTNPLTYQDINTDAQSRGNPTGPHTYQDL